jgi:hypothetical protein
MYFTLKGVYVNRTDRSMFKLSKSAQAQTPLVRFVVDFCTTSCTKIHNNHHNPQQSTTFRQVYNKSTTYRHVQMLWICCGLNNKSTQKIEKSTTSRKAAQQIHSKLTANPQQIEQVEFELQPFLRDARHLAEKHGHKHRRFLFTHLLQGRSH